MTDDTNSETSDQTTSEDTTSQETTVENNQGTTAPVIQPVISHHNQQPAMRPYFPQTQYNTASRTSFRKAPMTYRPKSLHHVHLAAKKHSKPRHHLMALDHEPQEFFRDYQPEPIQPYDKHVM